MSKIHFFIKYFRQKFTAAKKNKWVFTSFSGHYSDSPKYISQKLHEIDSTAEIVWLVKKDLIGKLPHYVQQIDIDSRDADKHRADAQVIIDNVYADMARNVYGKRLSDKLKAFLFKLCCHKKGRLIFTTWHGTPLKKMGCDQIGNDINDFVCEDMTMLMGNQFTLDIMKHLTFNKIDMKLIGTPRNDILFSDNDKICELKKKLGLPYDKKIVLFAPTFRNDGKDVENKNIYRSGLNQLNEIDFFKLFEVLKNRFGDEWVFVCRFHYHVEKMIDWNQLDNKYDGRIINGNIHDDMAEYLVCADLLITDASSCMFDYALTTRPCFLFFPDVEHYANVERGFYLEIESLPFPLAVTFDELLDEISRFDNKKYKYRIEHMISELGYADNPDSSQKIVEYILEQCKELKIS